MTKAKTSSGMTSKLPSHSHTLKSRSYYFDDDFDDNIDNDDDDDDMDYNVNKKKWTVS